MANRFVSAVEGLTRTWLWLAMLLAVAMLGVMLAEVVARYGLGRPLVWSYELAGMLNACMFLAAAAAALRAGGHVTVDILAERLPPPLRHAILAVALGVLFLPAIAWIEAAAVARAWRAFATLEVNEVSPWRHVLWPYYAGIALAMFPLLLQVAAEAVRHARLVSRRQA